MIFPSVQFAIFFTVVLPLSWLLDHLADDADPGRFQQLGELGEVVAFGQRGDAERALTRARRLRIGVMAVD